MPFIKKTILVVFILTAFFSLYCLKAAPADETEQQPDKDKIEIKLFKAHDDFTQTNTFKIKQPIILYVLWDIPDSVVLNGEAVIIIEGERVDGEKWEIVEKKYLSHKFASHYWGWDCRQKIHKKAKPGSAGTATVELKIDGYDSVKKSLTFKIEE